MIYKLVATVLVCLPLAACDWKTLDRIEGHDALGAAVVDTPISLPPEALAVSSASSAQPSVEPPPVVASSSSSSEYIAPLTEACLPGEKAFRLWDCGPDGHRVYW